MNKKAVIFDFNGTLFFDNDKHILAWDKMSKLIRQIGITEEELHTRLNGVPNHAIIDYFTDSSLTDEEKKNYSLMKEHYYREACLQDQAHFHLVNGVEDYFNQLKDQGIPFTIASASIKENIDFFIESFHLDRWMDPNLIVYDNGTYVNKVEMFKDAAKRLNTDIKDTLIFEDSFSGIKHAYEAGCEAIIVVCDKEKEDQYKDLPGVIKTIQDFVDER